MDAIDQRLRQLSADFSPAALSAPAESLGRVIRRGRIYTAGFAAAVALGASTAVLGAAVVVPGLIDPSPAPPPVLIDTAEEDLALEIVDEEEVEEIEEEPVEEMPLPALEVTSPADGAVVTTATVTVTGTGAPEAAVSVSGPAGQGETVADEGGAWSVGVSLASGANLLVVTDGEASVSLTVHYKPPAPAPGTKKDDGGTSDKTKTDDAKKKTDDDKSTGDLTLTANQQDSVLTGAPYKNRYWGTATPKEKIKVYSDYGWDYTYADASGKWELWVSFSPPVGTKTFTVTAKLWNYPDVSQTFSLKTEREGVAFTANQQDDVLESPYKNHYWGTTDPGSKVKVYSDYGEAFTWADDAGNWAVDLKLEGVTPGQQVKVLVINLDDDRRITFAVTIN